MTTIRKFESLALVRDAKSPYLHFRYTLPGLGRRQASTKEKTIEKAWGLAVERYQAAKLRARGEEPERTLRETVKLWVEEHALAWSAAHVANVERWGRLHLGELAEALPSQVGTAMAARARNAYRKHHAQSSTRQWGTYLRLIFKWAIRQKMIKAIPWELEKLHVTKRPKPRLPDMKLAEWLAAVDQLTAGEPSIGMVVRLMTGIGLRCSEARKADWIGMDFEHREYTPGDTKGGDIVPRPMPDWLIEDLRPMAKPLGSMVPTVKGHFVTSQRIQRVMDQACKRVGIQRLTPHRLRHSFATRMSEDGVPIQTIMAILEQKDIKTTAVYLGIDLSRVHEAHARQADRLKVERRKVGGATPGQSLQQEEGNISRVMHHASEGQPASNEESRD